MFIDQHPDTLGGMQTSVRLQRRFLERAGHRVSIVSPRFRGAHAADPAVIELPSLPLGPGEYSLSVPGRHTDKALRVALALRGPVDLVHVQADFWQAVIGYRFAKASNLPVVHTMHNRLDVGMAATMPFPAMIQRGFSLAQKAWLRTGAPVAADAWEYLARFADRADAITAPSSHFAQLLTEKGVFPEVEVVPNGMDDDIAEALLAAGPLPMNPRPRLVWVGRFSAEKRLLPFLKAVAESNVDAVIQVFGDGADRAKAEALCRSMDRPEVVIRGKVPYAQMLDELRRADALVQTSQGFETQGMTVFEAAALGTPSLLSDHRIAGDLPLGTYWLTGDDTVQGLASALVRCVQEISSGVGPLTSDFDPASFLQSRQTGLMLEVYGRAMDAHRG
ncbi:glycosyltransferase [Paeniglutamicibacter cryotolerans]|uniref:D-inositol 3-phosphate glycosyltransferase n=1 Tax=Paeniglutamicibacter cryotolerans TaxID=670079 RepID=A0A839QNB4_9MICC|nr:glycosyltransferase [Paeniglutamicibacter cryotolerans]MBB2996115.1 glycosyltransferase involved in cell wall biosynthesis [Paeniglutamicibacter cryotolerans]